jgi:hypothetical protein
MKSRWTFAKLAIGITVIVLIILTLRPVPIVKEEDCVTVNGAVENIYED